MDNRDTIKVTLDQIESLTESQIKQIQDVVQPKEEKGELVSIQDFFGELNFENLTPQQKTKITQIVTHEIPFTKVDTNKKKNIFVSIFDNIKYPILFALCVSGVLYLLVSLTEQTMENVVLKDNPTFVTDRRNQITDSTGKAILEYIDARENITLLDIKYSHILETELPRTLEISINSSISEEKKLFEFAKKLNPNINYTLSDSNEYLHKDASDITFTW